MQVPTPPVICHLDDIEPALDLLEPRAELGEAVTDVLQMPARQFLVRDVFQRQRHRMDDLPGCDVSQERLKMVSKPFPSTAGTGSGSAVQFYRERSPTMAAIKRDVGMGLFVH